MMIGSYHNQLNKIEIHKHMLIEKDTVNWIKKILSLIVGCTTNNCRRNDRIFKITI